jgi:hypothetical protein
MKTEKHWTQLQTEEAERVPVSARPFCWKHRCVCEWRGAWLCPECHPKRSALTRSTEATS